MQTQFSQHLMTAKKRDAADKIIRSCVHCGFCLATCPTYQLLGSELDSPRGRIYLIKSALENHPSSAKSLVHLDRCLTCRSCETTCPADVQYGALLDIGREFFEKKRPLWQKIYRRIIRKILTTPMIFNPIGRIFGCGKKTKKIVRPKTERGKVLLLSGCVQPPLAPNINHAAKNILARLGYAVSETPQKACCGALDLHLSAHGAAHQKIYRNLDAWTDFLEGGGQCILSTASGCGVVVKDYAKILDADDPYFAKAKMVAENTRDIGEFLAAEDLSKLPKNRARVSFHSPCTLQHGQKIIGVVEKILREQGFEIVEHADGHICCGSAGTYSIFQPRLARRLRKNKIARLTHNRPEMIATANIGCLMHLRREAKIPVRHWVELLDK